MVQLITSARRLPTAGKAASDIRRHNRALVLELIRTNGPISRSHVARTGKLSMPAVIDIVGELIAEGLVREVGVGPSSGGRRPVLIEIVPEAYCVIGVDVGTRSIRAVVTDLHGRARERLRVSSAMAAGPIALQQQLHRVLHEILNTQTQGFGGVLGIGMALPAPILYATNIRFSPPSLPNWGELAFDEWLPGMWDLPVIVENDAKAAALGELLYGAGRGVRNLFCVVAHRGVGGAAIVDGDLYRGADGGAGEIGHMLVDLNGPRCGCGRYGCLEALVGRAAIAERATASLGKLHMTHLADRPLHDINTDDVIEAALAGHPVARDVLWETGRYLGIGVANIVNLLNPELVVLGGTTMRAGALMLDPVVQIVQERALGGFARSLRIVVGELGQEASAIGAAALVLHEFFAGDLN